VTALRDDLGSEPQPPPSHRRPGQNDGAGTPRLTFSLAMLLAATGVALVGIAYSAGRLGYSNSRWADWTYWSGQLLVVVPIGAKLLGRSRLTVGTTAALALLLTVAEYLVNVCYSPLAFAFPDELWHWRSTVDLMTTGRLFTVNYALPISPRYPGLEELTSAFSQITGLRVFVAGLVIAGVAHLVFIMTLFLLFQKMTRSHRMAGIAIFVYAATPDLSSFDSMFVYQTLAVAFMALALLAVWNASEGVDTYRQVGVAILAIAGTVVTHHATSYFLAASLALLAAVAFLQRRWRAAAVAGTLTLIGISLIASWIYFVAPDTIGYFMPTVYAIAHGFENIAAYGHPGASTGPPTPSSDAAIGLAAVAAISLLIPIGWIRTWRSIRRGNTWLVAAAVASLSWYAIVAIRFSVADGSELAGRASTFIYVPVSVIVAMALAWPRAAATSFRSGVATAVVVATAMVLVFDGLINGWPPFWERLPGPYQVAGFERSVSPEGTAAARWAIQTLGPGNRFAADAGNYPMMASFGYQDPIRNIAYLYTSPEFTSYDIAEARAQNLQYLLVDLRLSGSLPASGEYFPIDPRAGKYRAPIPIADLTKFNGVIGLARIYDSGNIVIYKFGGF